MIITRSSVLTTILVFITTFSIHSQTVKGTILVISNNEAKVLIDGEELDVIIPNKPQKFEVTLGQHYLQVISTSDNSEKNEIIEIEEGKQQVLKYEFEKKSATVNSTDKILIAEIDFNIPGIVTAAAQENFEYPTYLYAFEKGDEIVLNIDMTNAKGTNVIEVFTYPDGNTIYSNDSFRDLTDVKIKVRERGMYGFSFASNHAFDRDARFLIERIPEFEETKDFNTTVSWKETFNVEVIQKAQKLYLNSGSHATFKGGKSRTTIPINLPENTVKWYYEFSASRNKNEVDNVSNALNLAGELSSLLDQTGILQLGINMLNQPPGSDYCDVYLIDHDNYTPFLNKQQFMQYPEGTRENLKAGIVEVECCYNVPLYLGLKNPDYKDGVHVVVEVAAIVKEEGWVMHHKD